jgi:hypothetical protein
MKSLNFKIESKIPFALVPPAIERAILNVLLFPHHT